MNKRGKLAWNIPVLDRNQLNYGPKFKLRTVNRVVGPKLKSVKLPVIRINSSHNITTQIAKG